VKQTLQSLSTATAWCPRISLPCTDRQLATILQPLLCHTPHRPAELACDDLTAAEQLPHSLPKDCRLLLCCPIVRSQDIPRLTALAMAHPVTVVVGHFRHVEIVAAAARAARQTISVLVELSLGRQLSGITAGPDAASLIAAIRRRSEIKLRALFLRNPCQAETDPESQRRALQSGLAMCQHTLRMLRPDGSENSAASHAADCSIVLGQLPVELLPDFHGSAVCNPWPGKTSTTAPDAVNPQPDAGIPALVVTRPNLELCVVACFPAITMHNKCQWLVPAPAGAVVIDQIDHYFTLQVSGPALDLKIGDEIRLKIATPTNQTQPIT